MPKIKKLQKGVDKAMGFDKKEEKGFDWGALKDKVLGKSFEDKKKENDKKNLKKMKKR